MTTRIIEWDAYADYQILAEGEDLRVPENYKVAERRMYDDVEIIDVTHRKLYSVPFYRR